jgi:predicted O-methyltransferase YrrM
VVGIDIGRAIATSDYDCDERRHELMWLAGHARQRRRIVEVGSWKGTTAIAMADNTVGEVWAVDTFEGSIGEEQGQQLYEKPKDWLLAEFTRNTAGLKNLRVMRQYSIIAAAALKGYQFDMIFLDASHDYESVKADILAWRPLLASGGLLCGHDRQWDGVAQAVRELIRQPMVGVGAIWYEGQS